MPDQWLRPSGGQHIAQGSEPTFPSAQKSLPKNTGLRNSPSLSRAWNFQLTTQEPSRGWASTTQPQTAAETTYTDTWYLLKSWGFPKNLTLILRKVSRCGPLSSRT